MFIHYLDLSWRSFKRTPLVSFLMVLAIAIGIGITMTSLSVYHMMSADPIPEKSSQLYSVQLQTMDDGSTWWTEDNMPLQLTYQDAENLLNAPTSEKKVAMMRTGFSVYLDSDKIKPFIGNARMTTPDFFSMFNLSFLYGGAWSKEQENSAAPVVVITQEINDKLFAGQNSVGELIYLDDASYQVVGVINHWPLNIKYYDLNNGAFNQVEELFMPFSLIKAKELVSWGNSNGWKHENTPTFADKLQSEQVWIQFWVELNTLEQKQAYQNYLLAYMQEQQKRGRFNRKELEYKLRDVNQWMQYNNVVTEDNKILVGLSFMFLGVCLANILGLLLAKFLRRAPEVGVRRALGASKRQIFLQHLVEVAMLGFIGGMLGIVLAQLGLMGVVQSYDYYENLATMDLTMLLSAPLIAITTCILAGLYPAWLVCKTNPAIYLKSQ
ncbi:MULTISPECIES: ABC transporter permease [unclassified Pseudoalteromonas]|uniref:ABC transporter permease n=1 Tax=unclassified Pseudoalteromonas TaxID=194690 RepID=UPI0013FDCE78|nr:MULTISPECIES: ABC transporter permease [unclassified Pseudoalteromonas]MBH0041803.1 ABC transporter permease [Pseudoalteromonas sp. SWXJZ10B]